MEAQTLYSHNWEGGNKAQALCFAGDFGKSAAWSGEQWKGMDKELHVQKGIWGVRLVQLNEVWIQRGINLVCTRSFRCGARRQFQVLTPGSLNLDKAIADQQHLPTSW